MRKIMILSLIILNFSLFNFISVDSSGPTVSLTAEEQQFILDHPEIKLGVDNRFKPYEFIDIDGVYKGICADYVELIERNTGLNFVIPYPELDWTEVYDKAKVTRELDLLACIGITTERMEYFDYSEPYVAFERAIFSNSEHSTEYTLEDLPDITVGVQNNSSHNSFLLSETTVVPETFNTLEEALYSLSEDDIDALVGNLATTAYTVQQLNITNIEIDSIISSENNKLAFAVNKDLPILTSIIDKGLASITEEEKIEINNTWIGVFEAGDGIDLQRILLIAGIILLVIIIVVSLIVYWNYQLQKLVRLRTLDLTKNRIDLVNSLVKASEFKNINTANHAIRVAAYSRIIFSKLYRNREDCEEFELSARLHDIGKIGITEELLLKPGRFTKQERIEIQSHSTIGLEILMGHTSKILSNARIISHQHHESYNGSGYPQGLKGDEIHEYARIVSIADVFDALTSYRSYKAKWNFEEGFNYIVRNENTEFDPALVKIFKNSKKEIFDLYNTNSTVNHDSEK